MHALSLLAALLLGANPPPATAAVTPGAATVVIRTPAALARYLHTTPPGDSPLDALTPAARRRFLASLRFGRKGLGGFSTADLDAEVSHTQAERILALFGMQAYARGLGLSPRRYTRVQAEREAYARRRGCRVDACPESDIERRYDRLAAALDARGASPAQHAAAIETRYDRLFGKQAPRDRLRRVARPDLRLLKRAAEDVISYAPEPAYLGRLRDILAQMQRRGMVDDADYAGLYHGLVAARRFHAAEALQRRHPGMGAGTLPAWHAPDDLPPGWPTAITLSADGSWMTRRAFDMTVPLRIVVVASCHFSLDAARAIDARPPLRRLFAEHAIWLADQGDAIDAARAWNARFPDLPIHIAWHDREWNRLDDWRMPTFYVFRHGRLVDQWSGWGAPGLRQLRAHLQRDGVLAPP